MTASRSIRGIPDQVKRVGRLLDRRTKWQFAGLFVLSQIVAVLQMLSMAMVLPVVTMMMNPGKLGELPIFGRLFAGWNTTLGPQTVVIFLGMVAAFFVVKNVMSVFLNHKIYLFISFVRARYISNLLQFYIFQPYIFHLSHNSAELLRNLTTSLPAIFSLILLPLLIVLQEIMMSLATFSVLVVAEPLGTIVMTVTMALSAAILFFGVRKHLVQWGRDVQEYELKSLQWIRQALGAVKEMKIQGREGHFCGQFEKYVFLRAHPQAWLKTLQILPRNFLEISGFLSIFVMVVWMVTREGRPVEDVLVALSLFVVAAIQMLPSVNRLMIAVSQLKEGQGALENIIENLAETELTGIPEVFASQRTTEIQFEQSLDIRGITYSYPGSASKVFENFSVTIGRGESIGIVGFSGAGKSTLVDLILGLLTPDAGSILVDGQSLTMDEAAMRGWQRKIGYVPQTIFLLDDTVRRNIAFGVADEDIDEARLRAALDRAHLAEVVDALPEGLDTLLGEDGMRLSGGQRQRVGIARALYHEPAVLILDEATSALDNDTEREINRAIEELHGERTILVIAHRLSTVRRCDRILFMTQGRIIDQGSFDDLIARNDTFRRLAHHGFSNDEAVPAA